MHIFLSGEKHIGKSTVVSQILWNFKCLGLLSVSDVKDGERKVYLKALNGNFQGSVYCGTCVFGHITKCVTSAFDVFGTQVLREATENADLVIIDEIGNMEKDAKIYSDFIEQMLSKPFPIVLGVLQNMAHSELSEKIRKRNNIVHFVIDENNRDYIADEIVRRIQKEMSNIHK